MPARRLPSLNWLRVFEAAARLESFSAAATELGMSPPAVSQQIRALESRLGAPLFTRGARSVTLTDAGRALAPTVRQAFDAIETTSSAVFGDPGRRPVTLQAITLMALSWLPARIAAFEAAHPSVRVDLTTGDDPLDFVARGRAAAPDLQIVFGAAHQFDDRAAPLFGERIEAVASAEVAAAAATVEGLAAQTLIDVSSHEHGWRQILARLSEAGDGGSPDPPRIRSVSSTPIALALARESVGVALARAPASDALVAALGLVRVPVAPAIVGDTGYFLRVTSPSVGRGARAFADALLSEAVLSQPVLADADLADRP